MFDVIAFTETIKYYLADILLISFASLFRGDYEILILDHAARRAAQRRIPMELLEKTIYEGKFERFGDNKVRIRKDFRKGAIICIGVIYKDRIKIITVEIGK